MRPSVLISTITMDSGSLLNRLCLLMKARLIDEHLYGVVLGHIVMNVQRKNAFLFKGSGVSIKSIYLLNNPSKLLALQLLITSSTFSE